MNNANVIKRALAASLAAGALCFASTAADVTTTAERATVAEPAPAGPATATPFTAPRYFNPYTPRHDNPTNPPGTWEVYPSPTNKSLRAVDFVDENNGYAVGASVALKYTNGTWYEIYGHSGHSFEDLDMVSRNDGWAVGWDGNKLLPAIWRWNGSDWREFQNPTGSVYCVDMINRSVGWIGGKNYFLRFNGTTWEWGGSAPSSMYDIQMNSDTEGRAVGYHYIMRRLGNNWVQEAGDNNWNIGRVHMVSTNKGWVHGQWLPTEKVMILEYTGTWKVNKIFNEYWGAFGIWAFVDNTVWTCAAKNYNPPYGGILLYYDGYSWREIRNPDPGENVMTGMHFFSNKDGWSVGSGGKIWRYRPNVSITPYSLGRIKAMYR